MSNYQKKSMSIWLLAVVNIISGVMHIAFEIPLLKTTWIYKEFLLIENMLIAFVFIFFGYELIKSNTNITFILLKFQILWWMLFTILVITFWGSASTLSMLDAWIPLTKSYILLATGAVGIVVSVINYIKMRNSIEFSI